MKSKLMSFVAMCLLYAIGVGQWSSPVLLLGGSQYTEGQALVAGAGDTMWATVVSTAPCAVYVCWTTGDTWSQPTALTPPDSSPVFADPGMGRDASGRLWAAWYNGSESSGVWTAFRDSTGWHAPLRAYSGYPAAGPMSFAADAQGNWYLGFALLTPYSSAVYCRWDGFSWQSANYIAQGVGDPIETNFPAPTLVTRPDSGVWVVYEICLPSDSFAMLAILQGDALRWCWGGGGFWPAATADSAGRLWIIQSLMGGYLTQAVVIDDSVEIGSGLVTDFSAGRVCATTDFAGMVWAAWKVRTYGTVCVNYSTGGSWSEPEQTSALAGVPCGIAADTNGRVYVLSRTAAGQLHSVYRTSRPGVEESGPFAVARSHPATIARGVLDVGAGGRQQTGHRAELLDAAGRKVLDLHPGANDVRALAPGVYLVREEGKSREPGGVGVRRVVITK